MLKLKKKKSDGQDTGGKSLAVNSPQGIQARGNALRSMGVLALLVAFVPIALGFAYLAMLREPDLQREQIDRIASTFATQQATVMHRLFTRLGERIQSAARSPLALSAIASQSEEDIRLVEQAMLDYFPELISLKIITIGEMGTAQIEGGDSGLRNHIEMDMVRRTGKGESTQPESYKFENRWLTSMTALIDHPRIADRKAVVIITLDNDQLSAQLKFLDSAAGKFALEQRIPGNDGTARSNTVAFSGSAAGEEFTRRAEVPGTPWNVSFTPSRALLDSIAMRPWPLAGVFAATVVGLLVAVGLILVRFPRRLDDEVNLAISAADKKTPLELTVPELVVIAKQLRRATLRAMRQGTAAPPDTLPVAEVQESFEADRAAANLTNPMFQSTSILDEDDEVLDLDLDESDAPPEAQAGVPSSLPDHVFRAYDIRGEAETELTDELVMQIGRAIGSVAGEMGEQTLVVGCDGRVSSPRIKSALIRSLMESGRDVIDIDLVPTPLLYFATRHLNCRSGVMVTGSHNPAADNGMKIVLNQQTIAAGGIQQLRERILNDDFTSGNGRMIREDIIPAYMEEVLHDIAIAIPLKIVIDAGNGATGRIAPRLFEDLGCEVVPLYCDVDGSFPNHPPDTSDEDNLADLARTVQEQGADFGVAFDGDGDRLAVVTSSGRIVRSDVLLMLYAQDVVSRNPGADVVFDVKCSRHLSALISRHGGRPVLWKTGHAFMKEKMAETGALLGGEFSGHMFFGERWYGFDDGMYAAARLAEILSTHGEGLDQSLAAFPETVNTPEILIPVPDDEKFALMEKFIGLADFSPGKVNTLDGIRVDYDNGWGLVRASNTVPALTARFEADTAEALEAIQSAFRAQISLAMPDLELNF
jgi:phosphomannomutase/phosphoglucomutase